MTEIPQRQASLVVPLGELAQDWATGQMYRGDGVTAGGRLITDAGGAASTVEVPVFDPDGSSGFVGSQVVSITSATSGASIRYIRNGGAPTERSGILYTGPFTVTGTETIQAIAYKPGMVSSAVVSKEFVKVASMPDIADDLSPAWSYVTSFGQPSVLLDDGDLGITVQDEYGTAGMCRPSVCMQTGIGSLKRYVMAVSHDHISPLSSARVWLAHADYPQGPWTLLNSGNPIAAFNGTEYPFIFQHGDKLYLTSHGLGGTYNRQVSFMSESSDGVTWSAKQVIMEVPVDSVSVTTGYAYLRLVGSTWRAHSLYIGGNYALGIEWVSSDDMYGTWTVVPGSYRWRWRHHLTNDATYNASTPTWMHTFERGSVEHCIGDWSDTFTSGDGITDRRLRQGLTVAHPNGPPRQFVDGSHDVVSPGGAGDPNEQGINMGSVIRGDDGKLYLYIRGIAAAVGGKAQCSALLAVADESAEAAVTEDIPVTTLDFSWFNSSGRIEVGSTETVYRLSDSDFVESAGTAGNGSFALVSERYEITNDGGAGVNYKLELDTDIDLSAVEEVSIELKQWFANYAPTDVIWIASLNDNPIGGTSNRGCAFGLIDTDEEDLDVRTYIATPGTTTDTIVGCNMLALHREFRRTDWKLILRPTNRDVMVFADTDQALWHKRCTVGQMVATGTIRPAVAIYKYGAAAAMVSCDDVIVRVRTA